MSLNNIELPNEVIRLILFYCQTSKDFLSQSLVNHQWSYEAQWIKPLMKTRFARKITSYNQRMVIWNFDTRITVIGHGKHLQRHGLEECVQVYHRVGGPGTNVYYVERSWQDGKLHGLEIVREINQVWYNQYFSPENKTLNERIVHPYEGLFAIDSMRQHRRHLLVSQNNILPKDCDYLGKILFKHPWNSGTLDDSKQLQRELIDEQDRSDIDALFNYLNNIDLQQFPMQQLPV